MSLGSFVYLVMFVCVFYKMNLEMDEFLRNDLCLIIIKNVFLWE